MGVRGGDADHGHGQQELNKVARVVSWIFLVGLLFLASAARGIYSSHGAAPSARFELLVTVSFGTFLWFWLKEQCRPYRTSFPLDIGFFVWWAGVVVIPYYLWRYQRWRGVAKLGVILSAYAAAYLFSLVVHYSLVWIDE